MNLKKVAGSFSSLDEPTNHLDLPRLEHIQEELISFAGQIIAVTHDPYFKDKIPTNEFNLEQYK